MKIEKVKIYNSHQANFLIDEGCKVCKSPFGYTMKTYNGNKKPYFYIEFIVDDTYKQINQIWIDRKK